MEKLVNEKEITTETQIDFSKTTSEWLIKQGFEREVDKYRHPQVCSYRHKELPIVIKPRKSDTVFFGDYEITFIETIYANVLDKSQLRPIRHGVGEDTSKVLNNVIDNMAKAFEIAKKFVAKIKKGNYL